MRRKPPESRPPDDEYDGDDGPAEGGRVGGGFAGSWARTRPTFDNPMSWSLPLMRVGGIDVRVHFIFLAVITYQLIRAALPAGDSSSFRLSLTVALILIVTLFCVVLLHEFGHCIACRRWGGVADEILMWPLGGLAYCAPPQDWRAHLWTAIGGPLVNVMILAVTTPLLAFFTGSWLTALPDPLHFAPPVAVVQRLDLLALFVLHWISLILLLFNLLPLFPLDGGRILQALLWPRLGFVRAMRWSCRSGFVGAVALGTLGLLVTNWQLFVIAIFGGFTCYGTLKQLEFTEETLGFEDTEGTAFTVVSGRNDAEERRERDAAESRRQKEENARLKEGAKRAKEEAEFDRILDKIRQTGIGSLSATERRALERETERRRRES